MRTADSAAADSVSEGGVVDGTSTQLDGIINLKLPAQTIHISQTSQE